MISVYLQNPGIPQALYKLLRISSHFGCGHVELAFYEQSNDVCVYAVRNMLRSNLQRLGVESHFRNLMLLTPREEVLVLDRILKELRARDLRASLATAEECVELAVSAWLLNPDTRDRTIAGLTRRYRQLARQTDSCSP